MTSTHKGDQHITPEFQSLVNVVEFWTERTLAKSGRGRDVELGPLTVKVVEAEPSMFVGAALQIACLLIRHAPEFMAKLALENNAAIECSEHEECQGQQEATARMLLTLVEKGIESMAVAAVSFEDVVQGETDDDTPDEREA